MAFKLEIQIFLIYRVWFDHSWIGLAGFSALSAFTVNSLFRRQLFVYEGAISGNAGIMLGTIVINNFLIYGKLQRPILKGKKSYSSY